MMKAITWHNSIYILGPGTSVTVEEDSITVTCGYTSETLNFSDSIPLMARLEKDELFKKNIKPIIGSTLIHFLQHDAMQILDLATQIVNITIEGVSPNGIPSEGAGSEEG